MIGNRIRLAISTCPNDTFAFHALMNRLVDLRGLEYEIELLDIQQLNERLFKNEHDVLKASFAAATLASEQYWVLPSGSALGFGVGPLLLAARNNIAPTASSQLTLCPGVHTTAHLLFRMLYPDTTRVEQAVFSEIMPRLKQGSADFGVCIHEGRFTWQDEGLFLVEDLGTRWETETQSPLPLGGLFASKQLPEDTVRRIQQSIRDSIDYALADPASAIPTMRHYAQEFDDNVLMQHVDLYVNEWTKDLGAVGRQSLAELSARSRHLRQALESVSATNINTSRGESSEDVSLDNALDVFSC